MVAQCNTRLHTLFQQIFEPTGGRYDLCDLVLDYLRNCFAFLGIQELRESASDD